MGGINPRKQHENSCMSSFAYTLLGLNKNIEHPKTKEPQTPQVDNSSHQQLLRTFIARDIAFLTQEDIAELAAVSISTVESWRKHNTGPAYVKFGKAFLYPKNKLTAFLEERMCDREEDKREIMKRCLKH